MLAGVYNLTIDQGATFGRTITVRDADNALYDFTNHTARIQIRSEIDSADVMIELTTENGRITLGGAAGTILLSIAAADTANLSTDGVYDLEIINGSTGRVDRLLRGAVKVELEVTR